MNPAHERDIALSTLQTATDKLEQSVDGRLIPPEGISFGFAIRGARDTGGVAAVAGGIRSNAGGEVRAGQCSFGTDDPVVRIILTLMKFNPVMRSAAILQFSDRALAVFENDLFLDCASQKAVPASQGISTMDWGIASCCEDGLPDVIVRQGTGFAGSRIIVLGEMPADVTNNIIICSNRV
jgi:predicted fused transcriptional regulator/phosphomethylpyrimidine kinase